MSSKAIDYITIRDCHQKMRENGAAFSEGFLRGLVANGTIPHLKVGNRRLISYETAANIIDGMAKGGR